MARRRMRLRFGIDILAPDNTIRSGAEYVINGAHSIVYSRDPEADRAFFNDVLQLPNVDVGGGWLIFGLPPAEIAVHPTGGDATQELYLMCEDIQAFVAHMIEQQIACDEISDEGWGLLSRITRPGGSRLGVYQPRHARPDSPSIS